MGLPSVLADDVGRLEDAIRELLTVSSRQMSPPASRRPAPLSERELHVLAHVAGGLSERQVARRMGMTEKTVRDHTTRALLKLGVLTRTEAAAGARRSGAFTA